MSAFWLLEAFWLGLVVVGVLLIGRWVLSVMLRRIVAGVLGRAIGHEAIASQPDEIHLELRGAGAWQDPDAASKHFSPLLEGGFRDAGTHRIAEMPDVVVRLLAHPAEGWLAAVYEHPAVGHWVDLVTPFEDGTSVTFTTSHETGLDPRPGHPVAHLPELDAHALLEHATRHRPAGRRRSALPEDAAAAFTSAYAESMRWRKQAGITATEVARVAERMDRAA